ncbi:MAG: hypothetical protein P1U56_25530 [Saprospiraceae bacterium]|nr:hypothetical protein [Saprospiraceae bacterium]
MKPNTNIEHDKIIDGFAELYHHKKYIEFHSNCGICSTKICVTPRTQKYVLEVKGVPVKMMKRGALFCENCRKRRARINYLKKGNKFIEVENGKAELKSLRDEEYNLKWSSGGNDKTYDWPY